MAQPATRESLKQYALRALGKPVIEINADDDQLEDRIDEALQYFTQYHYDAIRRTYLKYQYTQEDYNRMTVDASSESTTKNSITSTWKEGQGFIVVPESVVSVINVLPFSSELTFGESTSNGQIVCNIFVPSGQGMKRAYEICDLLKGLLDRNSISGYLQTTNSFITNIGVDEKDAGLYSVDFSVNFRSI